MKKPILSIFFLGFSALLFAQNISISYQNPDGLTVCGADNFSITLNNGSAAAIQNATVQIILPAGLTYQIGTASGASEQNISNLGNPIFGIANLPNGGQQNFTVGLEADCKLVDEINSGQLFSIQIKANWPGGSENITTNSFKIETGLVIVNSVAPPIFSGEAGDMFTRIISVTNTRQGKIGSLHFTDQHFPGLEMEIPGVAGGSNTSTFFEIDIPGSYFKSFGDGDEFFEFNETILISEKVMITDCGLPPFSNESSIKVGWGCKNEVCQFDTGKGEVSILTSTKNPKLVFETEYGLPMSYCADAPSTNFLKITNTGNTAATNVQISLGSTRPDVIGLDVNSFLIDGTKIQTNLDTPGALADCNPDFLQSASIVVPLVPAGQTVVVAFDTYFCGEKCGQAMPRIEGNYFYNRTCPPTAFDVGSLFFIPDTLGAKIKSEVNFDIGVCLQDNQTYNFKYWVNSKRLTKTTGFLTIKMDLPWGLFWDDTCTPTLDGQVPYSLDANVIGNTKTEVKITFKLPFSKDSVNGDFCMLNVCQDVSFYESDLPSVPPRGADYTVFPVEETCDPCVHKVKTETILSVDPDPKNDCGVSSCDEYKLILNCGCRDAAHCVGGGVKGLVVATFNTFRTNLGLKDANDDRTADSQATAERKDVRLDRFIPGDTLHTILRGVVLLQPTGGFKFRMFHEVVVSDMGKNDGDIFDLGSVKTQFVNYDSLKYLGGKVKFVSGGQEFICPIGAGEKSDQHLITIARPNIRPYQELDKLASMFHEFTIDPAGCLSGGQTVLNPGDSVIFECDYTFLKNVVPKSNAVPPLMNFRTTACDNTKLFAWNFTTCAPIPSQFSGFREQIGAGVFSIKSCESSFQTQPFFYNLRIARENMFPFEVRKLAQFTKFEHTVPPGLILENLDLSFFKRQEIFDLFPTQPMPHTLKNGVLALDFSKFFEKPIDEGLSFSVDGKFAPSCDFLKPDSAITTATIIYPNNFHNPNPYFFRQFNPLGYYANLPNLKAIPAEDEIETGSPDVAIDFFLKNIAVAPSQNTWVRVITADGSLANIELFKMPGGQPVPQIAGVFQLGQHGGFFDLPYQIRAKNLSCEPLRVFIIYGWDCQPVTSPGAASCAADTVEVLLKQLQPELELVVKDAPTSINLCEASDYFEIEIYNANEGTTFDVFSTMKLPDGLTVVAGSCQISYPTGQNWKNIADPTAKPGNVFSWEMEKLLPALAANGLPGVDKAPQNGFKIRFKVLAECGFVANAQPVFGTEGKQACGAIANTLRKPDEPIVLNGVAPIYDIEASLGYVNGNGATGCGAEQELEVSLNLKGQAGVGDSVYLLLPAGIEYVLNSYLPGQNAPTGDPKISGKNLQWPIPTNLGSGATIRFKIKVKYTTPGDCSDQAIVLQTRQKTTGFCVSTNSNCPVFVATGEAILFFNAQNPELILKNFKPSQTAGGQVNFTADLANIGSDAATKPVVQFYIDKNSDGKVDAGDQLVLTSNISGNIAPGDAASFSGNLNLATADLCKLIAHIPAAENCACEPRTFPLDGWNLLHSTMASCEVQPVTFGVLKTAGFNYGWTPSTGLSCTNCEMTTFTPGAAVLPGDRLTFILTESSPGCTIEHQFEVQFAGELGVETPDQKVCLGEKVTLEATPGGSYNWSGAGITSPNLQSQILSPTATTTYFVTVTFAAGCTGTDDVTVTVLNKNQTDLGEITICQGEKADIFGKITDVPGEYFETLKNQNGCDSVLSLKLKVLETATNSKVSICPGSFVQVFDSIFTEAGQISRTFKNSLGCDSTHSVTISKSPAFSLTDPKQDTLMVKEGKILNVPGGFASYEWIPATGLSCSDCPNPTATLDTGKYEFKVVIKNAGGCADTLTYRAIVFPPCDPLRLPIPTAFTPNGDQTNDVFRVAPFEGLERVSSLEIYNRWGERIFLGSGASAVWDGKIGDKPAVSDTYIYILRVNCPFDGEKKPRHGDVTVLR